MTGGAGEFRFGDTRHTVSDISQLQALGWEPTTRLRGIVEKYAAWAETQPEARDYYEEAEAVMKRTGTVRKDVLLRGEEIDLVALDGQWVTLVGECKWTEPWVKLGDLNDLKRKATILGVSPDVRYALFSRSGFDPNLVARAEAEGVLLYAVSDLYRY